MPDPASCFDLAEQLGHEELLVVRDVAAGLRAVIAIHDTTLGPAVGGTRMRPYQRFQDAVDDALRLSRSMTLKAVMAGVACGGAKAVIVGHPGRDKNRGLLVAYARAVDRLGGRFHTGGDMGIDARDTAVMARITRHVSASRGGSGMDVAALTALGVVEAVAATGAELGSPLDGLHVAVQGLGQVGQPVARRLAAAGARLTVCDADPARVERLLAEVKAESVEPEAIYEVEADVFSPNAMGGILDRERVARLRCRAVAGAANEQLADPESGDALHALGILYAPDYVASAGGLLTILAERGEADEAGVVERAREIGPRLRHIFERSREGDVPPHRVADAIAAQRLAAAREQQREARHYGGQEWGPH
jgi:leucine dehydrogenase